MIYWHLLFSFSPNECVNIGPLHVFKCEWSAGMLKVKLQLPPKPQPFYLMKPDNIIISDVTGSNSESVENSWSKQYLFQLRLHLLNRFSRYEVNKQDSVVGEGRVGVTKLPICIVYIIPQHSSLYALKVEYNIFFWIQWHLTLNH